MESRRWCSRALALVAALGLPACALWQESPPTPRWSDAGRVSPPLRENDARLVFHVPDAGETKTFLGLDRERIRIDTHQIVIVNMPAGKYDFVVTFQTTGAGVIRSVPIELGPTQTRFYRVNIPGGGAAARNITIHEVPRKEVMDVIETLNPLIRSYSSETGTFFRALAARDATFER
ncbi:MAG: hypothetical protein JRG76_05170 [Deltaproteobacteria bacterium]|nr:hypothetical protein [Deltaproteobacteria bacterium]MBW2413883.1 hypothetical protein [Deltaproteobacteria bacterium]